jgi:hypothetical protein
MPELRRILLPRTPVNRCNEKGRSLDSRRPFSLQGAFLTTSILGIDPACAVPPEEGTMAPGVSRSIMRVQQNPEYAQHTLLLGRLARPQHIGVLRVCPTPRQRNVLSYEQVCGITRYSIVPAFPLGRGTGAPGSTQRPRAGRRTAVTRGRAVIAAGRRRRRALIFYAVAASVAGELAAIVVDMEALVLLFSLTGLFLCTVIFRAAKR